MILWLNYEKSVYGRARIRQSAGEWRLLLSGTRRVCA